GLVPKGNGDNFAFRSDAPDWNRHALLQHHVVGENVWHSDFAVFRPIRVLLAMWSRFARRQTNENAGKADVKSSECHAPSVYEISFGFKLLTARNQRFAKLFFTPSTHSTGGNA